MYFRIQIAHSQLKGFDEASFLQYIQNKIIPEAEGFIDSFCGHGFGTPSLGTLRLDGNGKSVLFLPRSFHPAIGFTTATVDGVDVSSNLKTYDRYIKLTSGNFTKGEQNVVLYGSYGYLNGLGTPIIPPAIQGVCAELCANVITQLHRRRMLPDIMLNMIEKQPQSSGANFQSLFSSPKILTPDLQEILAEYYVAWVEVG